MEISISEARERLSDLVNEIAFGKKNFVLNRRGKKLVALISIEDFEELKRHKTSKLESNKGIKQ